MPLDKNFIVVTAILGGLLVWSMVREPEKPREGWPGFLKPGDDPPVKERFRLEDDYSRMDYDMGDREQDPELPRDPDARAIMEYIGQMSSRIIGYRQEMEAVFADGVHRSTSDLEQNAPKWFKAFNDLYALCVNEMDKFKQLQVRLNEEFGELSWVAANLNIIQIPTETRLVLDGYKSGTTYQQVYIHRLNAVGAPGSRPQTRQDYMNLNTNQQHNEDADDYNREGSKGVFSGKMQSTR